MYLIWSIIWARSGNTNSAISGIVTTAGLSPWLVWVQFTQTCQYNLCFLKNQRHSQETTILTHITQPPPGHHISELYKFRLAQYAVTIFIAGVERISNPFQISALLGDCHVFCTCKKLIFRGNNSRLHHGTEGSCSGCETPPQRSAACCSRFLSWLPLPLLHHFSLVLLNWK